jgi:hypothetical protein
MHPSFGTSKLIHKIKIKIKKSPWSPYLPLCLTSFLLKGKSGSNLSIWRARLIKALHVEGHGNRGLHCLSICEVLASKPRKGCISSSIWFLTNVSNITIANIFSKCLAG